MPVAVDTARIRQSLQSPPGSSNATRCGTESGPGNDATALPHSTPPAPSGWLSEAIRPIRPLIARALPDHVHAARFIEATLTELRSIDKVIDCPPSEICRGVMRLAQLGLEPGPAQHVNLYPTWSKARATTELLPRPTYRGVMELARRSGMVRTIRANPVYSGEDFDHFFDDSGEHLLHRPTLEPTDDPIAFYAVAYGHDKSIVAVVVLSIAEIERRRSFSRRAHSGAWVDHYEAMATKTAILALGPFLPLTAGQVEVLEGDTSTPLGSYPPPVAPLPAPQAPTVETPVTLATVATGIDDPPAIPGRSEAASPTSNGSNPETGALTTIPEVVPEVVPDVVRRSPAGQGKGRRALTGTRTRANDVRQKP